MMIKIPDLEQYQAIIWDFDGVLVITDWGNRQELDKINQKLFNYLEKFEPQIREVYQNRQYSYQHTDYVIARHPEAAEQINQFMLQKELSISIKLNQPLIELAKSLPASVDQFIWSNNQFEFIEKNLKPTGLLPKIKEIVSLDKARLAKPNLDGWELIKNKTKAAPEEILFVGDSLNTDQIVSQKLGLNFFHYQ